MIPFPTNRTPSEPAAPPPVLAGLIPTKLHCPRLRPVSVLRSHLVERIEQGLWKKLTLISAAAGSGKTTLVTQWMQQTDAEVAWLSLDEADNQPVRFIHYLLAAIRTVKPEIGQGIEALLQTPTALDPEQLLTNQLITPLAAETEHLVLVLDDLHLIENAAIHDLLVWFLEHLPACLHLLATSRTDPPLPLARFRVRDELNEIRAEDLRFTRQEAAQFCNRIMHLELNDDEINALESRTEGWIAGIQLAALSLQSGGDRQALINTLSGDQRLFADYLVQEVLERQPPEMREFLLRTSVLQRLCGPLCDAVTDRDDGQTLLEQLERANLFLIPLDERRQWYRYHHLFADLLRQRLNQEKPGEFAPLQRLASRWYDRQGLAYEAVEHARQADDPAWLTELVERWGEELLKLSELDTLRDWVSLLPEQSLEQRPLLAVLDSWCALFGTAQQLELSLNRSQTTLANSPHLDAYQRARLQGHWASIRAFATAREGNPQQGVSLAEQALAQLPGGENMVRAPLALSVGSGYSMIGNLDKAQAALTQAQQAGEQSGSFFALIGAMACQGELDRARGRLRDGIRICREAIELAQHKGCTLVLGYTRAALARLHMDRWELQEAQVELEQAVDLIKLLGDVPCLGVNRAWLARLKLALGDQAAAANALAQAVDLAEKADWSEDTRLEVRAQCALAELAHSHTVTHRRWLGDERLAELDPSALYHQPNLVRIKFAIRQGRCAEALPTLERLIKRADREQRHGHALEWRILQTAALLGAGQEQAALDAFEHSIALAQPEGFLRAFAEDWDLLEPLAMRLKDGRNQPYWNALNRLVASSAGPTPVAIPDQVAKLPLLDNMSTRELEVLCWVAQGLSNRAIADKLFVSVGTVKTHLHNILAKLAVGNRTEAVHRARSLGLIA